MKKNSVTFLAILCFVLTIFLFSCQESHKVNTTWEVDGENHWHTCLDCEELFDKGAHDMQFVEKKEVSCTEDGYELHKCSICGYQKKDMTDATGHSLEKHNAESKSCTTNGAREYYSCSKCGKYYLDIKANEEIQKDEWIIPSTGHELTFFEGIDATFVSDGQKSHYHCDVCDKYFEDDKGEVEITDGIAIGKLISNVKDARSLPVGTELTVRGVVVGVTTTQASLNLVNVVTLKDENSNDCIALYGGKPGASSLADAMGTAANMQMPFEKGTVLEIPVTISKTSLKYANGNAGIVYLQYQDTEEELSSYVKGTASYKFDLQDEDIIEVSTQEDFFKLLGLANGSNVFESEGFAYSYEVAGANTFKLIKMTNLRTILITNDQNVALEKQLWRPCFTEDCTNWAKTAISNSANSTNKIGAKQSFYPSFYNYNTYVNTGKTFSELLFGDTTDVTPRTWTDHKVFDGTVYAMFVGGSDYYCQFAILDNDWVIKNQE